MFTTSAPLSTAQTRPAMTSESAPVPLDPSTTTGMIVTPDHATPAMPVALFVFAAMIAAIAVPWPLESAVSSVPVIAL